ncbi:hypothetical protein HNQ07_003502 [Deinococcus metalli]|uniref:Uncharacterized protein n=1 Tax=Deinococcus metalli TaxID=1141878 RepID=A0A7W8KJB1_9DEIO|nr:hypothetical protein [Deinococcus metalli]MBB5378001.1 hypothetical protein [Deinococcus metalli]GHF53697.1 hypothetical protein GCM10017781_32400 [Deinococcus metalli]
MDTAELERWKADLPVERDALEMLLEELQAQWLTAQAALIPAIQLGNGYLIQQDLATLNTQIRVVEAHLTH